MASPQEVNRRYTFITKVTAIEEDFAARAIYNPEGLSDASREHRFYTVEKRSLGWFAVIGELGIRVRLGDTKPHNIGYGSLVTLSVEPLEPLTVQQSEVT